MNVALDKLRDISRKSDEDKISRLRQELQEANERISQVAEFSMEAIQECNNNIDRIKNRLKLSRIKAFQFQTTRANKAATTPSTNKRER